MWQTKYDSAVPKIWEWELIFGRAVKAISSPGVCSPWLTLSQPGGVDYAHHITTDTPGFSDLPTALHDMFFDVIGLWFTFFAYLHFSLNMYLRSIHFLSRL